MPQNPNLFWDFLSLDFACFRSCDYVGIGVIVDFWKARFYDFLGPPDTISYDFTTFLKILKSIKKILLESKKKLLFMFNEKKLTNTLFFRICQVCMISGKKYKYERQVILPNFCFKLVAILKQNFFKFFTETLAMQISAFSF